MNPDPTIVLTYQAWVEAREHSRVLFKQMRETIQKARAASSKEEREHLLRVLHFDHILLRSCLRVRRAYVLYSTIPGAA